MSSATPTRPPPRGFAIASLAVALSVACGTQTAPKSTLVFSDCRLDPVGTPARCTSVDVFENRAAQRGRVIQLRVAVLTALAGNPRPDPLFLLVGGPGQAATEAGPQIMEALRNVRRWRDVVLVDQRGTGSSNPLDCKDDSDEPLARRFAPELDLEETVACRAALDADTSAYATPVAMDDLDDVRSALGYERINLWGGSYGTRAALVYYRQHPERVRSMVLDGAAPPSVRLQLSIPKQAERALDLTLADCERDADCRRAFPNVRATLALLLAKLARAPHVGTVLHPRTHLPEELRIDRSGFAMALLASLYATDLSRLVPLAIERAYAGDYGAWIAMASAFSEGLGLSTGMFLSVVCAEDIVRITASEAQTETAGTFLGAEWLGRLRAECGVWPSATLPESYFAPIGGRVPALILSGELDPVTPPAWGEIASRELTSSTHVIVPGAGHGVSVVGCVPSLIASFLEAGDTKALDLKCLDRLRRPAFFTSLAGPKP